MDRTRERVTMLLQLQRNGDNEEAIELGTEILVDLITAPFVALREFIEQHQQAVITIIVGSIALIQITRLIDIRAARSTMRLPFGFIRNFFVGYGNTVIDSKIYRRIFSKKSKYGKLTPHFNKGETNEEAFGSMKPCNYADTESSRMQLLVIIKKIRTEIAQFQQSLDKGDQQKFGESQIALQKLANELSLLYKNDSGPSVSDVAFGFENI